MFFFVKKGIRFKKKPFYEAIRLDYISSPCPIQHIDLCNLFYGQKPPLQPIYYIDL